MRKLKAPLDGVIVDGVLSREECAALVAKSEELQYSFWDPSERVSAPRPAHAMCSPQVGKSTANHWAQKRRNLSQAFDQWILCCCRTIPSAFEHDR